jgi:hypothetical protein
MQRFASQRVRALKEQNSPDIFKKIHPVAAWNGFASTTGTAFQTGRGAGFRQRSHE